MAPRNLDLICSHFIYGMPMFEFDKSSRLLKSYEYQSVFGEGIKDVSKYFVIFGSKNDKLKKRLGLVVSKKVGNSVERNRIKRILREQFRLISSDEDLPTDFVVVARPGSKKVSSKEVKDRLMDSISRIQKRVKKTSAEKL